MFLVGSKNDTQVYFNTNTQSYTVMYKGNVLIKDKYKFVDVKAYIA